MHESHPFDGRKPSGSILVTPGWWVETLGKYKVKAMNANYLVTPIS